MDFVLFSISSQRCLTHDRKIKLLHRDDVPLAAPESIAFHVLLYLKILKKFHVDRM